MHRFLREDLECLRLLAKQIQSRAKQAGKDMGESCEQSAETYHDNFPFEEAQRQLGLWSGRLGELTSVLNSAQVIPSPDPGSDVASIGHTVEFIDENDLEKGLQSIRVGSYMNFDGKSVSYEAPLAKLLLGARPGDTRRGTTGQIERVLIIIGVSL